MTVDSQLRKSGIVSPREPGLGGSQESMWVILAKMPNNGDMEPEEAASCSQARIPSGGRDMDTNPPTKLSTRNCLVLEIKQVSHA